MGSWPGVTDILTCTHGLKWEVMRTLLISHASASLVRVQLLWTWPPSLRIYPSLNSVQKLNY